MWLMLVMILSNTGDVTATSLGYFASHKECIDASKQVQVRNVILPTADFPGVRVTTTCVLVGANGYE